VVTASAKREAEGLRLVTASAKHEAGFSRLDVRISTFITSVNCSMKVIKYPKRNEWAELLKRPVMDQLSLEKKVRKGAAKSERWW
jgi:hypothetical protein